MVRRFTAGLLLLFAGASHGHDARPVFVEIVQRGEATYLAKLKAPDSLPRAQRPALLPPADCEVQPELPASRPAVRHLWRCGQTIEGRSLALRFPSINPSLATVFRVELAHGVVHATVLPPGETAWVVPDAETRQGVALEYGWLGVKHIWLGVDHLLFVLCLLFVAGRGAPNPWRRILVTVTGFTVAHSITLALAALRLVSLPTPAVEAVIALSIVFLAVELLNNDRRSWTWRYPASVAASFGLLHGFGFASALREAGLPQTELPVALLCFNLGVEAGQILFIAAVLPIAGVAGGRLNIRERPVRLATGYVVGTLAACWLIDRTLGFWSMA